MASELIRIGHGTNDAQFGFMGELGAMQSVFTGSPYHMVQAGLLRPHFNTIRHVRVFRGTALRSGDESSKKPGAARAADTGAKVQSKDRDMGAALRTVYQRTVEEAIPPEMLDLLGKLD
ncbi:MAG: hypothetical protein ACRCS5_08470 [Sphingomonas sp.]|jgi:hypothetical protein|uniref:hypothetical protein n=1 Tax=unclassified Sphingomonas TaxID=196159 RepID=UPI0010F67DD3|nr:MULTISPECIES: hypothetical protein [unclassified Sphingomonas]MDR6847389.1 hypothetical protein [Sphingomonas sp. BE137]MDR7256933.1 hypothetical protein [Sphingomonas sp. BE270]